MSKCGILIALVAFAAGVGIGMFADALFSGSSTEVVPSVFDSAEAVEASETVVDIGAKASTATEVADSPSGTGENDDSSAPDVSSAVIEVMVDDSSDASPEILAAHAARQARRAVAREAKVEKRRNFLSNFNPELLTDRQRATHELFVEAMKTSDEVSMEIRRLRAAGEDVPLGLQSRLTDAQSVLRADHDAEYRALREAAARASGLDEEAVRQIVDVLDLIDREFPGGRIGCQSIR